MRVRIRQVGNRLAAVRASGAAGLGAGTEGVVNDGLDGTRASATLGAATETVVAEDVAGTNNHENGLVLE